MQSLYGAIANTNKKEIMAVSVDTVYQRVLTLANKEQRGYITPQEFNLLANHAQVEIFEQYFADIAVHGKLPGNTEEYSDIISVLYEKIGEFSVENDDAWMGANMIPVIDNTINIPVNLIYKIGTVKVNGAHVEIVSAKDFSAARSLPLTAPSINRPMGIIETNGLRVAIGENTFALPGNALNMSISYVMRPPRVEWAYVVVNDKALYNDNISINFELHASEETELVYKILKLAGINLKAQEVTQVGASLEQVNKQTTL